MVVVNWTGGLAFEAVPPSGNKFTIDAHPAAGGENKGPTPVEALLSSIAACSAMDVLTILQKKRMIVRGYRIEVEGVRVPEGTWPRPFTSMVIRHILLGDNLDPRAVEHAVELSDEKYCSVLATLRQSPEVKSEWRIENSASTGQ
jgi:putative redox protein